MGLIQKTHIVPYSTEIKQYLNTVRVTQNKEAADPDEVYAVVWVSRVTRIGNVMNWWPNLAGEEDSLCRGFWGL